MGTIKYSMESEIEAKRLEEQIYETNYNLAVEFSDFEFKSNELILDAGCGTGVLARYLSTFKNANQITGFDFSELRIYQAKELLKKSNSKNIELYVQDLNNIDKSFHNKFDTVICRYVLEHVEEPDNILNQLKKTLKPDGRIILIDLDGVFINLYSSNEKLNSYINRIRNAVKFDLTIGRKLPNYLKKAGFHNINWSANLLTCKNKALQEEMSNTEKRFIALEKLIISILNSKSEYQEFMNLYLFEMSKPENTLCFTKYIVTGKNCENG